MPPWYVLVKRETVGRQPVICCCFRHLTAFLFLCCVSVIQDDDYMGDMGDFDMDGMMGDEF